MGEEGGQRSPGSAEVHRQGARSARPLRGLRRPTPSIQSRLGGPSRRPQRALLARSGRAPPQDVWAPHSAGSHLGSGSGFRPLPSPQGPPRTAPGPQPPPLPGTAPKATPTPGSSEAIPHWSAPQPPTPTCPGLFWSKDSERCPGERLSCIHRISSQERGPLLCTRLSAHSSGGWGVGAAAMPQGCRFKMLGAQRS